MDIGHFPLFLVIQSDVKFMHDWFRDNYTCTKKKIIPLRDTINYMNHYANHAQLENKTEWHKKLNSSNAHWSLAGIYNTTAAPKCELPAWCKKQIHGGNCEFEYLFFFSSCDSIF